MRNDTMSAGLVTNGVTIMARIDDNLTEVWSDANALAEIVEQGVSEGMVPSALNAKDLLWEARALAGDAAKLASRFAAFHKKGQKAAEAAGEDTGSLDRVGGVDLPQTRGGTR